MCMRVRVCMRVHVQRVLDSASNKSVDWRTGTRTSCVYVRVCIPKTNADSRAVNVFASVVFVSSLQPVRTRLTSPHPPHEMRIDRISRSNEILLEIAFVEQQENERIPASVQKRHLK